MRSAFDLIEEEIRDLRRQLRGVVPDTPETAWLPTRWSYRRGVLCWQVFLVREVLEPDLDVELTPSALIVRARPVHRESRLLAAVLPVPSSFDGLRPDIRFESEMVEIRIPRRRRRGD